MNRIDEAKKVIESFSRGEIKGAWPFRSSRSFAQAVLDGDAAILRDISEQKARQEKATALLLPLLPEINALGFVVSLHDYPRRSA